ncbi:MAG: FeoA domain-containing protein [Candidatus Bathyarchaeia archaeon]
MEFREVIVELMEFIVENNGRLNLDEASSKLNRPKEELVKALDEALSKGLIRRIDEQFKLTVSGESLLESHREEHLHRMVHSYVEETTLDRVRNWSHHWRLRHGFSVEDLNTMRSDLKAIPARIEEIAPLSTLSEGERGKIVYIYGGRGLVRRLADMGLTPGIEVVVLRRTFLNGPVEITVRGTNLALGYGVAKRVFIKRVS